MPELPVNLQGPQTPAVRSSYLDAWNQKLSQGGGSEKGAHVRSSHAASERTQKYACQHRRPSPGAFKWPGDGLAKKAHSVLHRPKDPPQCRKNKEMMDVQYHKDLEAFERHANTFRRLAHESYHHNAPEGSIITLWEAGHIVDRGRRPMPVDIGQDPILGTERIVQGPALQTSRPQSAPHHRSGSVSSERPPWQHVTRKDRALQEDMGCGYNRYNPITHTFSNQTDQSRTYHDRKQVEWERSHAISGKGLTSNERGAQFTYNPILGEMRPVTAGTVEPFATGEWGSGPDYSGMSTPAPAAVPIAHDTVAAAVQSMTLYGSEDGGYGGYAHSAQEQQHHHHHNHHSQSFTQSYRSARPQTAPAGGRPPLPAELTATPHRRTNVRQGETWGTYDPILHTWSSPPNDPRFDDQNAALERKSGLNGLHHSKAPTPPNQGVYDPIRGTWLVPPANQRHIMGNSFAPATIFSRPQPCTPQRCLA